ncbi:MAG: glycosyl hydrolase, partial [Kineosporiaceae bacterium]
AALAGWDGAVSVAVGALVAGETWAQAADGAFVARWTDAVRTLAAARAGKGPTFIQIAHEMNGDWMAWSVTSSTLEAFRAGWRRYAAIIRAEFPAARLVFTANAGTASDIGIPAMWPGDDVVDVYGVDLYTGWAPLDSRADWEDHFLDTELGDSPRGLGAHQAFAQAHGKPLAFPEWGLRADDPSGSNHPDFITNMHTFMSTHAAAPGVDPAGRVIYDVYFNVEHDGDPRWRIDNTAANPRSAAAYAALTWGTASDTTTTTAPPDPPPLTCPPAVPTTSASPGASRLTPATASPPPGGH